MRKEPSTDTHSVEWPFVSKSIFRFILQGQLDLVEQSHARECARCDRNLLKIDVDRLEAVSVSLEAHYLERHLLQFQ